MNYYEEVIEKVESLIKNEEYLKASIIIDEELSMAYIPKDIETKLRSLYESIKPFLLNQKHLNDDEIEDMLTKDEKSQLIAVSSLINKNLRNYLELINKYLTSDGLINAKVILIDALIRQEISDEIKMNDADLEYSFIPKYLLLPEESDGFIEADRLLNDYYIKEPSKYLLAKELLYKDVLLRLPINVEKEEALDLVNDIKDYIDKAFQYS